MVDSGKQRAPTGGCWGIFRRIWYSLSFMMLGSRWNLMEIFTCHRKLDIQKIPRREGDVAVITGGARGIGKQVIKQLLILDMQVIIGVRNEAAGNELIENIRSEGISTGSPQIFTLDLKSLESVREFANNVLKNYRRIHLLINNAGIMLVPYEVTKDGLESHFQVNYLSHFLLTQMLLPKLKSTGTVAKPSRIVNVSSCAAYGGKIFFEDLQYSKFYSPSLAYMTTKLLQVVFTKYLEDRLKSEEANVHVYAVHPGVVKTGLYENMCMGRLCGCLFKSPKQGSDTVVYAAVSPKVENEGGCFYANSKKVGLPSAAKKIETQKRLWTISCELTGFADGTNGEQAVVTVENENRKNGKGGKVNVAANGGEADSDMEDHYETNRTADGSLDEKYIDNQREINIGIAKKILNSIEDNTELAIKEISKEFVDDVVGKSVHIVNERGDSESSAVFQYSPVRTSIVSEILSEKSIDSQGNSNTHAKVQIEI